MTVQKFLRSKGLYALPLIADVNSPEDYYSLAQLIEEYAEIAWNASREWVPDEPMEYNADNELKYKSFNDWRKLS